MQRRFRIFLPLFTETFLTHVERPQSTFFTSICRRQFSSTSSISISSSSLPHQQNQQQGQRQEEALESVENEETFTTLFNSRPVAERVAATFIAQRYPSEGVPLKTFVEQLPRISRDDIFKRSMRVEEWVQQSVLIKLVEDENGLCCVKLAMKAKLFMPQDTERDMTEEKGSQNSSSGGTGAAEEIKGEDMNMTEKVLNFLRNNVLGPRETTGNPNYKALNETYSSFIREASTNPSLREFAKTLKYGEFLSIINSPRGKEEFWILNEKFIATRLSGEKEPPRFVSPQPRTLVAHALNGYGGWGDASKVPTRQDVYEILKYVPVNWGNFGNINIPAAVKKKHIRISSTLQWFRRQPFYFELRNLAGTTEIRRSILLHPELHGLTPEEAHERLQLKIAKGEANSLAPVNPDGDVLKVTESSPHASLLLKFVTRVCPGYFVPISLIIQRYTKKSLTSGELLATAKSDPDMFEVIQLRYTDTPLLRKRIGADSARWKEGFVEDFERYPEDVRGLIILMGRVCSTWDRPHYVYVRLTEEEKVLVGGFEGMMKILKQHAMIFRVGENFIARVDLSDPLSLQDSEPPPEDLAYRIPIREENPYQTPRELAVVFHYVAPDDEPCTAAFFLQCASPAMRAVLPPRIVTLLQLFPDLFVCKETSPGVFLMRKVKKITRRRSLAGVFENDSTQQGEGTSNSNTSSPSGGRESPTMQQQRDSLRSKTKEVEDEEEEEAVFEESDGLSREEVIQSVKMLVPPDGVEASRLLLWASLAVQQAANRYYGGVLKLVEANRAHFRVHDSQESKMIYPEKKEGEIKKE